MSLQDTLQQITSQSGPRSGATSTAPSSQAPSSAPSSQTLANDARNIMAALFVRPAADVRRMIDIFAPVAEAFLQELVSGKYPDATLALRAKYASLALARAGHGPIHNVRSIHAVLTAEDMEEIKRRAVQYVKTDAAEYRAINPSPIRSKEVTQSPAPVQNIAMGDSN